MIPHETLEFYGDTIVDLQARLEAAEARAVAAERALADLKAYADDTFLFWGNDADSKVGKRLMWMSGTGNRGYEPNLKHIHEISTAAARELMRKAAEWDETRKVMAGLWEEKPLQDAVAMRIVELANGLEADTLRTERDTLAAQNVQLREALEVANKGIEQIHDDWLEPESWSSAGCGQAAAHCLNISFGIDAALALPLPESARQVQEWKAAYEGLVEIFIVNWVSEPKDPTKWPEWKERVQKLIQQSIAEWKDPAVSEEARKAQENAEKAGLLDWMSEDFTVRGHRIYLKWCNEPEDGTTLIDALRAAKETENGK